MQHYLFQQVMQYKQYFTSAGCCNIAWYRSLISKLEKGRVTEENNLETKHALCA